MEEQGPIPAKREQRRGAIAYKGFISRFPKVMTWGEPSHPGQFKHQRFYNHHISYIHNDPAKGDTPWRVTPVPTHSALPPLCRHPCLPFSAFVLSALLGEGSVFLSWCIWSFSDLGQQAREGFPTWICVWGSLSLPGSAYTCICVSWPFSTSASEHVHGASWLAITSLSLSLSL